MAISFRGMVRTYPILGNNDLVQNLFTIGNGIASRVNVIVRRLTVQNDAIVALTAVVPLVKVSRATAISGGLILDKGKFDTVQFSDEAVIFRAAMYESARIVATPADTLWQKFTTRLHTAVEQVIVDDANLLTSLIEDDGKEFILRPNEGLLVSVVAAIGTSNAALTNNWLVQCIWSEDEIATFNISGVVTLNSVPVVGAKVIIVEAKDKSLTDAILREVKTTTGGGVWSSTIRTGWVGGAFVQYETGGTLYTAPGSPFLENV
jgi:hypothetical protein